MESTLKQSASSSRIAQLDKINAIPNKTTNHVLLDDLCYEDRLYLSALMDEDSSDTDNTYDKSSWSTPMAERPMVSGKKNKRLKRMMKPTYAITLSLEDISYIRPSWGMSKGLKRIELSKQKRGKKVVERGVGGKTEQVIEKSDNNENVEKTNESFLKQLCEYLNSYHVFLTFLVILLIILVLLSYTIDMARYNKRLQSFRLQFQPTEKSLNILKSNRDGVLSENRGLRLNYGKGIPDNLRPEDCTCEMFASETMKYYKNKSISAPNETCFACYNWAQRANLQVYISKFDDNNKRNPLAAIDDDLTITCYNFRWQSYDTLRTPLIDCIQLGDEQWFGLGDVQNSVWPLNKFNQLEASLVLSNLTNEFGSISLSNRIIQDNKAQHQVAPPSSLSMQQVHFGSHVAVQFITSNGFYLGNLNTDFQPLIKISHKRRELCLSAVCTDKCTQTWTRSDYLDKFKYENNLLEYSICSASSWRHLVAKLVQDKQDESLAYLKSVKKSNQESTSNAIRQNTSKTSVADQSPIEYESQLSKHTQTLSDNTKYRHQNGIGLIERIIFTTSQEFNPTLDGQTLRQHVDKIVKLNLKTSPILLLDTRWQTYVGSFKINGALFPKAKLLFEILHNKGFKIVLEIKPYIDTSVGISSINNLLELNRLVTAEYNSGAYNVNLKSVNGASGANIKSMLSIVDNTGELDADTRLSLRKETIVRRRSFFKFENETIFLKRKQSMVELTKLSQVPLNSHHHHHHHFHHQRETPYLFSCRESYDGHCVLIDLMLAENVDWMIELIKNSVFLTQEADGILVSGTHPDPYEWDNYYRKSMSHLIDKLYYDEHLYVLPRWTGNFNYIQLAPRPRTWIGLRSMVDSVINLSLLGYALVNPGSVWGDLPLPLDGSAMNSFTKTNDMLDEEIQLNLWRQQNEELIIRWLQVSIFLPILQFNDLTPIDKYNLHDQLQTLVRIRKLQIVPELKLHLPYTTLVHSQDNTESKSSNNNHNNRNKIAPVIRQTWQNTLPDLGEFAAEAVAHQFQVGPDILVAPILMAGQRQRDIYLPLGIWHDELRQTNIRGGKWLRNYPVELNEIAWFTRARRRR